MAIPDVFVGQLGDGRWEVSTKGTCGHRTVTYLDERPEGDETALIGIALQKEVCSQCSRKRDQRELHGGR